MPVTKRCMILLLFARYVLHLFTRGRCTRLTNTIHREHFHTLSKTFRDLCITWPNPFPATKKLQQSSKSKAQMKQVVDVLCSRGPSFLPRTPTQRLHSSHLRFHPTVIRQLTRPPFPITVVPNSSSPLNPIVFPRRGSLRHRDLPGHSERIAFLPVHDGQGYSHVSSKRRERQGHPTRIQDECCMQADQRILMSKTRPDRSLGKHRSLRISQAMVEEAPSSFLQNTGRRHEKGHCHQLDHTSENCDIAAVKI